MGLGPVTLKINNRHTQWPTDGRGVAAFSRFGRGNISLCLFRVVAFFFHSELLRIIFSIQSCCMFLKVRISRFERSNLKIRTILDNGLFHSFHDITRSSPNPSRPCRGTRHQRHPVQSLGLRPKILTLNPLKPPRGHVMEQSRHQRHTIPEDVGGKRDPCQKQKRPVTPPFRPCCGTRHRRHPDPRGRRWP